MPAEADKLLEAIFAPGDWIEFRSIRPGAGGRVHEWHQLGQDLAPTLERLRIANETDHAFFGANPRRDRGGSKAADVALARCLFADFDRSTNGEKRCNAFEATHRIREVMLPTPTALINTGNGCHAYWRLDEPIEDMDLWSRTQRALIRVLKTDGSIHDAPRCMRLPGFANVKYSHRPVACIVFCDHDRQYPLMEFPDPLEPRHIAPASNIEAGSMSELARKFIREGYVMPHGRRATIFTVACDLASRGWSFESAEATIMDRAKRLDLDPGEIDDIPRQIANAFSCPREPVDDEPIRIVSRPAEATETPQDEPQAAGRTLTLRDAIGLWRQHQRPQAVPIRGMFSSILPDGLPTGQIMCVAAAPGVGKTALALQMMAFALFDDAELKAVWAMGEMTADRLAERVIAAQGGIAMDSVRNRSRDAIAESERIAVSIGDRMTLLPDPLFVHEIDATVEATGAKLVVVDYLQLVRGTKRNLERRQEVDGCLRDLRSMAMQRGVALVLISNLAKGVNQQDRPDSIDIGKESSEIAYQVDVMLFGRSLDDGAFDGLVEWQCCKNRHGPQQDTTVRFVPELQVFQFAQGQG
jgi:hypothetical protein